MFYNIGYKQMNIKRNQQVYKSVLMGRSQHGGKLFEQSNNALSLRS